MPLARLMSPLPSDLILWHDALIKRFNLTNVRSAILVRNFPSYLTEQYLVRP